MRKHRRKILRKSKNRKKRRRIKSRIAKHLDSPITNRFTRLTTYMLIVFESVFVLWWLQCLLLEWQDIIARLKEIFGF